MGREREKEKALLLDEFFNADKLPFFFLSLFIYELVEEEREQEEEL